MEGSSFDRRAFLSLSAAAVAAWLARTGSAAERSAAEHDVVIYGGSSAGVIAAVQARRMGKTAVIVDPYGFLGGMTTSGLNSTDADNPAALSGLARAFFADMGRKVYGKAQSKSDFRHDILVPGQFVAMESRTKRRDFSRVFEPHVAERAFNELLAGVGVRVFHHERLDLEGGVLRDGRRITAIRTESGKLFAGKMFIDATYEGDLMAGAGVRYIVGRESNAQYGETVNGFQIVEPGPLERLADFGPEDHFVEDVDPYVVRGDPSSGLLPLINSTLRENGAADPRVQAYNYRVILADDPANQIPFAKPEGYRELDYELLLRNFEAGDARLPGRLAEIPNRKIDWNTFGAVGTDMAGANVHYTEADHQTRVSIDRVHERYTRGYFWTLAHHPRVPAHIRAEMQRWGYAKDEFERNGGFPYMLYVREARRMVSDIVMTEHHGLHRMKVEDPVTLATFSMDSHVVQYVVNRRGFAVREGVFNKKVKGPYGVSYRSIIPQRGTCPNLLVPVCLSASHVAHGSIRMEPVFMSLGQAAATAASLAIDQRRAVQEVPYAALRERLLADQMMLEWKA